MKVYLDNAATTPLSSAVFSAMEPYVFEHFGNASSAHGYGRIAKAAVSNARQVIAELLNATPEQIIFTSGGTESDNTAILSAIRNNRIRVAITSRLEHHAVLNTLKALERNAEISILYLDHDSSGNLSLTHLQQLLQENERALVSLMHGNNEIGNLNDIGAIDELCCRYGAIFHSDTVQTMGHMKYDTRQLKADFLIGSAHKFHGPKGVGFLYKREKSPLSPFLQGGAQEGGQRGGTENVAGIVGLAKALEIACSDRHFLDRHISGLKQRAIDGLLKNVPGVQFNGNSGSLQGSLNAILNISLPQSGQPLSALDLLDRNNICASGGSACNSHSSGGSHVLNALGASDGRDALRLSFSRYNTLEEIDYTVRQIARLYHPQAKGRVVSDDRLISSSH